MEEKTNFRALNRDVLDIIRKLLVDPLDKSNLTKVVGPSSLDPMTYIMNLKDGEPNGQVDPKSRMAVFSVAKLIEYCYECFINQYEKDKVKYDDKVLNKIRTKTLKSKGYTIWLLDYEHDLGKRNPQSIIQFKMITNAETNIDECHFTIKTNSSYDKTKNVNSDNSDDPDDIWIENMHCILYDNQEKFDVTLNIENLKSTKDLELPKFLNGEKVSVNKRIDVFRFAAIYFTQHLTKLSWFPNFVYKTDPIKASIIELLLVSILKKKKIFGDDDGISDVLCGKFLKSVYTEYLIMYQPRLDPELPSKTKAQAIAKAIAAELQAQAIGVKLHAQIGKKLFYCRTQLMMAINDAKILKDLILLPEWQLQLKYYTYILIGLCDDNADIHFPETLTTIIEKIDKNNKEMDKDQKVIDLSKEIDKFLAFVEEVSEVSKFSKEEGSKNKSDADNYKYLTEIAKILKTSKSAPETIRRNINDNVKLNELHNTLQVLYETLKSVKSVESVRTQVNSNSLNVINGLLFKGYMDTLIDLKKYHVPKYIEVVDLKKIRIWAAVDNLDLFHNSLNEIINNLEQLQALQKRKEEERSKKAI